MARVRLAEIHFGAGRADLAMAELDAIKDSRVRDPDVYAMAAELLEERGDERGALLMHRRRPGGPSGSSADRAPNPPAAQRPGAGSLLPHQGGHRFDHRLDRTSLTSVAEVDVVVVQTLIGPR
jgi:hypothetical protein